MGELRPKELAIERNGAIMSVSNPRHPRLAAGSLRFATGG